MKNVILDYINQVEKEKQIAVLYACEAGSRAWGMESQTSDYDVRLIYVYPATDYLQIDPVGVGKRRDVMERKISKTLDITGWELTKALRLFRKSNPTLLEWLHSEIIYHQRYSTIEKMKQLEPNVFSSISTLHHYLNMAKRNFKKASNNNPSVKLYINVLRPILISKWIIKKQHFPPVNMEHLIEDMIVENEEKKIMKEMVQWKRNGQTTVNQSWVEPLDLFVKNELEKIEQHIKSLTPNKNQEITQQLNKVFQETLQEVWGD